MRGILKLFYDDWDVHKKYCVAWTARSIHDIAIRNQIRSNATFLVGNLDRQQDNV